MLRNIRPWTLWTLFLIFPIFTGCDDGEKNKENNADLCGNGVIDTGEQCDGDNVGELTCASLNQGFDGGQLACGNDCQFDVSGCLGCDDACNPNDVRCNPGSSGIETCVTGPLGCTVWENEPCPDGTPFCESIENTPTCVADCVDLCELDVVRCNPDANGIETCVTGPLGCTVWENEPCLEATPVCEDIENTPTCVTDCDDLCELDVVRCNPDADGIETCVMGPLGCTVWENEPCLEEVPACELIEEIPTCLLPNGSGDTCLDAYRITVPFLKAGTDFTLDFPGNDLNFTDGDCLTTDPGSGTDAVFAVELQANEAIIITQGGGLDGMIYVQHTCGETQQCLEVMDDRGVGGVEEVLFSPGSAQTYYIIVKAFDSAPSDVQYLIAVWHYEDPAELSCDDGFDNDLDGLSDCDDPDCFGAPGLCDSETVCDDGLDNDADGDPDCFDDECADDPVCGPENTPERCSDGVDNDADGHTDCDDTDCMGTQTCPTVLIQEGFDPFPPINWMMVHYGEGDMWKSSAGTDHVLEGSTGLFAVVDSDAYGDVTPFDEWMVLPELDFTGFSNARISFRHHYVDYSEIDFAYVDIWNNDLFDWVNIVTFDATTTNGAVEDLDLSSFVVGVSHGRIRFRYVGNYDYYWLLDDVRVIAW